MSKYYGFFTKVLVNQLVKKHSSKKMQNDDAKNPATAEQQRLLAFGAVLLTQNSGESFRTISLHYDFKEDIDALLSKFWDIEKRDDALPILDYLSNAEGHTPFVDDVYNTFVKNGRLDPIHPEELLNPVKGLENAYRATLERIYDVTKITNDLPEEVMREIHATVVTNLAARINSGLTAYKTTKEILLDLGFTEGELLALPSTASWDLGRACSVARYCVKSGYIQEDEAYAFMQRAADKAVTLYKNWREFFAAYLTGRALGYGNDSKDMYADCYWLIKEENSPYQWVPFK